MREFYHTDSKIVLAYLFNKTKKFQVCRKQSLSNTKSVDSWYHVNGGDNPADIASRGATAKLLTSCNRFTGPSFLWNVDLCASKLPASVSIPLSDPEVKVVAHSVRCFERHPLLTSVNQFSKWLSVIRFVALIQHVVKHR